MKSWSRTRFIFYQWLEGMSFEERLRMLCLSGLEKRRLEMTDLMKARCRMGFLIIGLVSRKGLSSHLSLFSEVFLLAAYFHTNKDI